MTNEEIATIFNLTAAYRTLIASNDLTYEQKGRIISYISDPDGHPKPDTPLARFALAAILADCNAIMDARQKQRKYKSKSRACQETSADVNSLAPARAYNKTKLNKTKQNETKCVCDTHTAPDGAAPGGANAHTHTRFEFSFEDVDFAGLRVLKIPRLYAQMRYKELAATGFTLADGKHIDLANFNAHVLAFWKHEKDKAPYSEALKTEVETAKLAGRVWERKYWDICAERGCIHANTHERGWGCKLCAIPPPQRPRPVPPEECDKFDGGRNS